LCYIVGAVWPITENLLSDIRTWRKEIRQAVAEEREPTKPESASDRTVMPWDVLSPHDQAMQEARQERDKQYRTQEGIRKATICAVIAAGVYAAIAAFQWCEMRDATIAATSTARTAAKEFELSERPWVDAGISLVGPLKFDENGARVNLNIALRNTGHSPALNTWIESEMFIGFTGPRPSSYSQGVCERATHEPGTALFPNAPFAETHGVGLTRQEIEKEKSNREHLAFKLGDKFLLPVIIVCISYHPVFDEKKVYHTSYILELMRRDEVGNPHTDFKIGQDIPLKDLFLQLHFEKAIEAN
jgi:hypothetical protein